MTRQAKDGGSRSTRSRRSSDEIDEIVVEAARAEFASKGYSGTSMRDIAERAGVYEPMIYRRFESKSAMFEAAVLKPFLDAVTAYVERAEGAQALGPTVDIGRSWIAPMYALMKEHWKLVMPMMVAESLDHEELGDTRPLSDGFKRILEQTASEAAVIIERRKLHGVDVQATILAAFGMVLGVCALEELLRGRDRKFPKSERLVEEMIQLSAYGIHRSGSDRDSGEETVEIPRAQLARMADQLAEVQRRATRAEDELRMLSVGRPAPRSAT